MFETGSDISLSSDDGLNNETTEEEWSTKELKFNNTVKDSTLLHSILTETSSHSSSTSIYQPALKSLERMTVTENVDEQKCPKELMYNNTPTQLIAVSPALDLENGADFGYSQKFFHIADGNLYSVFSPLQGRSYGGKPSFLRKQRCTVQESQGRRRKSLKRGLKFHNFLPSESITSEKEDKPISREGEIWKVHAECRLREEHGTKQIMVSNWSVKGENPKDAYTINDDGNDDDDTITEEDNSLSSVQDVLQTVQSSKCISDAEHLLDSTETMCVKTSKKGTELKAIVDKLGTIPNAESEAVFDDEIITSNDNLTSDSCCSNDQNIENERTRNRMPKSFTPYFDDSRRKRRKPLQTRKVVPYNEYLSMLENETSSPLDLSSNSSVFMVAKDVAGTKQNSSIVSESSSFYKPLRKNSTVHNTPTAPLDQNIKFLSNVISLPDFKSLETPNETNKKLVLNLLSPGAKINNNTSTPPPVAYVCPVNLLVGTAIPSADATNTSQQNYSNLLNQNNSYRLSSNESRISGNNDIKSINSHNSINLNEKDNSTDIPKNHISKARGRSNQRTIIRKKLEDTFRQNGFLVKTKQVSDGEATFCKFRQLRKYTRYYLKSWQHHLPEEVHKLWKGFLPPKTAIPPSTGGKREEYRK